MIETFSIFIALALSFLPTPYSVAPSIAQNKSPKTTPSEPHISIDSSYTARSILLFNLDNNNQVAEFEVDKILPIASITKIMTGYIALKNIPLQSNIHMSKESIEAEGAVGHFIQDEIFSFKDILESAMIASSNDAAMALAERVGQDRGGKNFDESIIIFVNLMNETAKNLGMNNTNFINPTGLDNADHTPSNYSSAKDLALLLKTTQKETPLLWEVSRSTYNSIYSDRQIKHNLSNLNILAPRIMHFIGGKTGSTDAARESVVELFEAPFGTGRGLIVLGADPGGKRFEEASRIINQITSILP